MAGDAESRLIEIAETQHGLFTTAQAEAVGFTEAMRRTRLAKSTIRRIYRDVFFIAGQEFPSEGTHMAAVLAAGDTARASHRAAAWLWGLTSYAQKPEITITSYARVRVPDVRVHRTVVPLLEPAVRRGVPSTTAAETLLDLGAVKDLESVQKAIDRGIANKVLTPMAALAELDRRGHTGVRGTASLRRLLDAAGVSGSHHPSVLEARTRRLIQKAGLPQPECELVVGRNGEYRLDFAWPALLLAIEVDGWMYHASAAAFQRNKTRKNSLTIQGYAILEYTWMHVTRSPSAVVREIAAAYAARARVTSGHSASFGNAN